jgi:hypothetical protein
VWLHKLDQRFEAMHGAEFIWGIDLQARRRYLERIAFVVVDGLDGRGRMVNFDDQPGRSSDASSSVAQAGDHFYAPLSAVDCVGEARTGDAKDFDGKRGVEGKSTGIN